MENREMTLEQRKALALASARLRMQQQQATQGQPSEDMQRMAYMEAQAGLGEGMPQPGMRTTRVASEAPFKALAGAADMFIETPLSLYNLGKAAVGYGATAMGRSDLAPDLTPSPSMVYRLGQRAGIISPEETQAQMTTGQRYLDVGLQGATGAMMGKAPALGTVGRTMGIGAASAMGGQGVAEKTESPLAGVLFSTMAAKNLTTGANKLAERQMETRARDLASRNEMSRTLETAQNEGYAIPRGYYEGKQTLKERAAGGIEKEVGLINQVNANKVAQKELNLPENAPLTKENMQDIRRQEYDAGYKPLEAVGRVRTDTDFKNSVEALKSKYASVSGSFPAAARDEVRNLINAYDVPTFNSKDAMQHMRSLREDASSNFSKGENALAKTQLALADLLKDEIFKQIKRDQRPNADAMIQRFEEARTRMAKSHAVENSIVEGTGSINAKELAKQLDMGLTGGLQTTAKLANAAPRIFPERGNIGPMQPPRQSGIPGGQAANFLGRVAGLAGFGGYTGGHYGAAGGAALAVTPEVISALARNRAIAASRNAPSNLNALNIPMLDQNLMNRLMTALPVSQQPYEP